MHFPLEIHLKPFISTHFGSQTKASQGALRLPEVTSPVALALSPQPPEWPRRIAAPSGQLGVVGSVVVYELLRRLRGGRKGASLGDERMRSYIGHI